ncbi:MAG TPA: DUF885 domain-containing protein, partial [Pseudoxanthomonas sp.]|nr:DUF885 domain-containing protein [Pseudoxanthomonas sp.]
MLRRLGWTALVALMLTSASLLAQTPQKHAGLHQLFAEEWERGLRENPENATYSGDNRYNDRWTDYSLAAIAHREAG